MKQHAIGLSFLFLAGCGAHLHGTVVSTTSASIAEVRTRGGELAVNDTVKIVHRACNAGMAANAARRQCALTEDGLARVVDVVDAHHARVQALGHAALHTGDDIE
jgi:hypothetical protein